MNHLTQISFGSVSVFGTHPLSLSRLPDILSFGSSWGYLTLPLDCTFLSSDFQLFFWSFFFLCFVVFIIYHSPYFVNTFLYYFSHYFHFSSLLLQMFEIVYFEYDYSDYLCISKFVQKRSMLLSKKRSPNKFGKRPSMSFTVWSLQRYRRLP